MSGGEVVTVGYVDSVLGADVSVDGWTDVVVSTTAVVEEVSAVLVETVVSTLIGFVVDETRSAVVVSASVDVSLLCFMCTRVFSVEDLCPLIFT